MALDLRPTPPEALPFLFEDRHRALAEVLRRLSVETLAPAEDAHARAEAAALADGHPAPEPAGDRARALARTLAGAGVLGLAVPEAFGGVAVGRPDDLDVRSLCLAREHLAWASGLADTTFAMQGLGTWPVTRFGTEAQKRSVLPAVARGEQLAAFALTEAEAGSDVGAMACRATQDGDGWRLDGEKTFISNAGIAGPHVVFATTEPGNKKAACAFLVHAGDPGFTVAEPLLAAADHPLGTLRFDGCRLPADRLLGEPGQGLKIALSTLDVFRTTVAAAALGLARRALDEATHRALARRQFGRPIADHQQVQAYLAESAVELEAARLLTYRAAWHKDTVGGRVTRPSAMAKLFATEAAQRIVDRAVQLHGGTGVLRGVTVERLYREVRALRIYEGTSEIQRLVIAGDLLREAGEAGEPEPR